uniref:Molybdopterin synthase catalytic subunit n=1 Tax=Attheya septentrionalis TaxID=420275 RepID=A0A7S2XKS3_9STRA|mmetsp:Transcript_16419/g.29862  ORF Transcript_16419/g.29862 Transcript_16419/m.29862 type:complete len:184 (+) Transcript_16419:190-741(+)
MEESIRDDDAKTAKVDDRYLIEVSENMPSLGQCYEFVEDPCCGAISSFVGVTRDNFNGKQVAKLSYEGYVPMAKKELHKLCDDATAQFPSVAKIAAVHILGDCPVGKASVILCASSPHRMESIHCVEFLINELKARIPIWKREVYEGDDAGSVWKENMEWKEGRRQRVMIKEQNTTNDDVAKA